MDKITLNSNQQKQLEKFIFNFFEPTGTKRKNSGNELDYVYNTLDRVFKQNFGFNLNRRTLAITFEKLGFAVFYKNETYNSETKKFSPSVNGEIKNKTVGLGNGVEAPYTYFDIDPKIVRQMMRTTSTLPETTNQKKYFETKNMRDRILEFRGK
jgi:hypothetical protein